MTFLSQYGYIPQIKNTITSQSTSTSKDITVVIPVKDNQRGIEQFLDAFYKNNPQEYYPYEIIIVDNPKPEIVIPEKYQKKPVPIRILHCYKKGPASARNIGWKAAQTKWILFSDSDCMPQKEWISGYMESMNGSVGYAGNVKSLGKDIISRYYELQRILIPPPFQYKNINYPEFLITANSLVWKPALEEINGFNEDIQIAAGEDIDLGFRLREIGSISYAQRSLTLHNFDDGLVGFIRRFTRYGEGNKKIAVLYNLDLKPKPFKPIVPTLSNIFLSKLQKYFLEKGYSKNNVQRAHDTFLTFLYTF